MAIQFPNFLGVPVRTPDYSGLGNVVDNYYAGKNMKQDELLKKIQAEFARPNAEQSLLSSKLANKKSQIDINKLVEEMAQQKAFEKQLTAALGGNGMQGGQMAGGAPSPMNLPPENMNALAQSLQQPQGDPNDDPFLDITKMEPRYRKFDQMATGLPKSAYRGGNQPQAPVQATPPVQANPAMAAPAPQPAPVEDDLHEITVTKGAPHLSGVDQMWENSPLSREFLKKKGYEKKQDIKFNAKTGQTTIITKYPSGRVTTQSTVGGSGSAEAPLTTKMVSKHQGIIAAVDNAIPTIEKILKLNKGQWEQFPRSSGLQPGLGWLPGYQSQATEYEAMVSSALDSLVGAYGLPSTNEGLETVKKQLLIGHGETDAAYKRRLKKLVEDLKSRQAYSANEVKKTLKNPPIDGGSGGSADFTSHEWEEV